MRVRRLLVAVELALHGRDVHDEGPVSQLRRLREQRLQLRAQDERRHAVDGLGLDDLGRRHFIQRRRPGVVLS